jgi:hypothetical protein
MKTLSESTHLLKGFLFTTGYPLLRNLISASKNIKCAQSRLLSSIVYQSRETVFGKRYNFSAINSMADYCNAVPVSSYKDYQENIDRMCRGEKNVLFPGKPLFYNASRTNNKQKLLPVSESFFKTAIRDFNRLWLYTTFHDNPDLFRGKCIATIEPAIEGFVDDGTPFGSMSGAVFNAIPKLFHHLSAAPYPIQCIKNFHARSYALMRYALAGNLSWIVATQPRMLMQFHQTIVNNKENLVRDIHDGTLKTDIASEIDPAERFVVLKRLSGDSYRARQLSAIFASYDSDLLPKHYWPDLACITTWKGGNCAQDHIRLTGFFPKQTIFREFGYQTNEVRAGIVLGNDWNCSILPVHRFLFEFIEVSKRNKNHPPVLQAHEVEIGKSYYLLVTNGSGLYRYDSNDIIRITGFYNEFPLFEFIQRGEGVTNATGEHISEIQVLLAFEEAVKETGLLPPFYTAFCDYHAHRYKLYAEFTPATLKPEKQLFTASFDAHLRLCNKEYATACDKNKLSPIKLIELQQNAADYFNERFIDDDNNRKGMHSLKLLQDDAEMMRQYDRIALHDE